MAEAGYNNNNPYCSGIVELEEGPRISAQILDVDLLNPNNIKIGTKLIMSIITRQEDDADKSYLAFKSNEIEAIMPYQTVSGIQLYYELTGPKEGPVLVLSNGIMMSTASWAFQKIALEKHLQVLLYDCRGMWKSDHPEGPYSMEQHAEDLAGLMNALDIKKAHIAGISYGAEISMVFAAMFPEMTQSLIVIDGVSEIHPLLKAQTIPGYWRQKIMTLNFC